MTAHNSFRTQPDERGHFGIFGGRFVAETLMPLILDLEKAYADAKADPALNYGGIGAVIRALPFSSRPISGE